MALNPTFIPRGCHKEIRKYQICAEKNGDGAACFNDKISIMEVCPDHVLEGLKEKKKWYLRAEVIDNETYRRAMTVGDYNKGRSVSDLKLKTWEYGMPQNLRTDSLWQDDRYNPTKYSHPHRYDNVNFPQQEYRDVFGGTLGEGEKKEQSYYKPSFFSGESHASKDFQNLQRAKSVKEAVKEANHLKKDDHAEHH
mmetsp:Transcript_14273/g.10320  ORF Transcript_14273/g.10320 Transcript_14273/m.10320 type:complete len:195 (+) Transcript_14273:326-910(+)